MKDKKIPFSILLILLPIFAFASGDEGITLIYSIVASIIFFLIGLIVIKVNDSVKIILIIVYALTLFLLFWLTGDIPYRENMNTINLCFGLIPIATSLIALLILKVIKKNTI
ncbi:MAG: hypothetical protein JST50_03900 [Bacteroidetes bacterium]|jgi:hypothetical protein|nr:hypothetical protein [Bacteroidota bacterium]